MDMEYVNINEFNDLELASRMRTCNYEKYKSLVRMHLSFELELNIVFQKLIKYVHNSYTLDLQFV